MHYIGAIRTYQHIQKCLYEKYYVININLTELQIKGELPYNNLLAWCEAKTQYKLSHVPKIEFWSYDFISTNHTFNFRRLKSGSSGPYF